MTSADRRVQRRASNGGSALQRYFYRGIAGRQNVPVSQRVKDLARGNRCAKECKSYSGVTVEFLRWFLANDRAEAFRERVQKLQRYFYRGIAGRQNDARIAANFAVLGAGFLEVAQFLGDVWADWRREAGQFITRDLVAVRDQMLDEVRQQQASEIFLATLRELVAYKRVQIEDTQFGPREEDRHVPVVGRQVSLHPYSCQRVWQVSTALALEAVQDSLRRQGRSSLQVTERALLAQLHQDGKLLGTDGKPLPTGDQKLTQRVRVGGERSYCFLVDPSELTGEKPCPRSPVDRRPKGREPPGGSEPASREAGEPRLRVAEGMG